MISRIDDPLPCIHQEEFHGQPKEDDLFFNFITNKLLEINIEITIVITIY